VHVLWAGGGVEEVEEGLGIDEDVVGALTTEESVDGVVGFGDDVMIGVVVVVLAIGDTGVLLGTTAVVVVVFCGKRGGQVNAGRLNAGAANVTLANARMER